MTGLADGGCSGAAGRARASGIHLLYEAPKNSRITTARFDKAGNEVTIFQENPGTPASVTATVTVLDDAGSTIIPTTSINDCTAPRVNEQFLEIPHVGVLLTACKYYLDPSTPSKPSSPEGIPSFVPFFKIGTADYDFPAWSDPKWFPIGNRVPSGDERIRYDRQDQLAIMRVADASFLVWTVDKTPPRLVSIPRLEPSNGWQIERYDIFRNRGHIFIILGASATANESGERQYFLRTGLPYPHRHVVLLRDIDTGVESTIATRGGVSFESTSGGVWMFTQSGPLGKAMRSVISLVSDDLAGSLRKGPTIELDANGNGYGLAQFACTDSILTVRAAGKKIEVHRLYAIKDHPDAPRVETAMIPTLDPPDVPVDIYNIETDIIDFDCASGRFLVSNGTKTALGIFPTRVH